MDYRRQIMELVDGGAPRRALPCRFSLAGDLYRREKRPMMPVPTHLEGVAIPLEVAIDEAPLRAELQCACGSRSFEFLFPGQTQFVGRQEIPCTAEIDGHYFFIIRSRCTRCRSERTLLDVDFHGWNGFVCHDPVQAAISRPPLIVWNCRNCGGTAHGGHLYIVGEGREDFLREMASDSRLDRWYDAFGWFALSCSCNHCGQVSPDLISCETM
jgi:hypothetical protein